MKRSFVRLHLLPVLLVIVLGAVAVGAGCGGGPSVSARAVLSQSKQSMQKVTSAKLSGTVNSGLAGENFDGTFSAEEQAGGPEGVKTKMVMKMMGQQFETYTIGTTTYTNVAGKWIKSSTPSAAGAGMTMGLGTLDDIKNVLGMAENPKVVSEDANSYTVSFSVTPDSLKKITGQALGGSASAVLGNMSMNMTMKVDKKNHMVTAVDEQLMFGTASAGSGTVDMKLKLDGINVPVNIQLPPAALSATEATTPNLGF